MAEKIGESLAAKVANKVEDEKEEDQVAKLQKQQTVIAEPDEASEKPKSEAGEENGKQDQENEEEKKEDDKGEDKVEKKEEAK